MARVSLSVNGARPESFPESRCWQELWYKARGLVGAGRVPSFRQSAPLSVRAVFHMNAAVLARTPVEDLAKQLLDTLFSVRDSKKEFQEALLPIDHRLVWRVMLDKHPVTSPDEEGIDVTVCWP